MSPGVRLCDVGFRSEACAWNPCVHLVKNCFCFLFFVPCWFLSLLEICCCCFSSPVGMKGNRFHYWTYFAFCFFSPGDENAHGGLAQLALICIRDWCGRSGNEKWNEPGGPESP